MKETFDFNLACLLFVVCTCVMVCVCVCLYICSCSSMSWQPDRPQLFVFVFVSFIDAINWKHPAQRDDADKTRDNYVIKASTSGPAALICSLIAAQTTGAAPGIISQIIWLSCWFIYLKGVLTCVLVTHLPRVDARSCASPCVCLIICLRVCNYSFCCLSLPAAVTQRHRRLTE